MWAVADASYIKSELKFGTIFLLDLFLAIFIFSTLLADESELSPSLELEDETSEDDSLLDDPESDSFSETSLAFISSGLWRFKDKSL